MNAQTVDRIEPAPSNSDYLYAHSLGSMYYFDPAVGTWQTATVAPPGLALAFAIDPTDPLVAYVGIDHPGTTGAVGGIARTTDGGRNWIQFSGDLDSFDVVSLDTHPTNGQILYAATRFGGAYRSDDGGTTWTELDNFRTVADFTNVNVQDPSNEFLLYAGTEGYGVQASVDGGRTFVPRVSGLGSLYVNALAFDPDDPSILYAGTDDGVYKSIDGGTLWAPTDLTAGQVADMATDNEGSAKRIWVTVDGVGVAYSDDGGGTFTTYSQGLASLELTSVELEDTGTAKRIWVTTKGGDGAAYSDDLGQTWVAAAGNGLTDRNANDVAVDAVAKRIWVTTDTGVFYSDDTGLSWAEISLGLPSGVPVTSAAIDPHTGEVLVSLFGEEAGGVYRGGNLRGLWTAFNNGLEELKVKKLTHDAGRQLDPSTFETRFFAATSGDGVYRSNVRFQDVPAPDILTTALPTGLMRESYSMSLAATGGITPYYWSLASGSLPPGMTLAGDGGLSGTPAQSGLYGFEAQVADDNGRIDRQELLLAIAECELGVLDLELENITLDSAGSHEACASIVADPDVVVDAGGLVTFRAGSSIVLGEGFAAHTDFAAELDPSLLPTVKP